jgi:hypothetical protein
VVAIGDPSRVFRLKGTSMVVWIVSRQCLSVLKLVKKRDAFNEFRFDLCRQMSWDFHSDFVYCGNKNSVLFVDDSSVLRVFNIECEEMVNEVDYKGLLPF